MTVPEGDLAAVQAAIAAAHPASDSLTINGETYTWQNFESLVDQVEVQSPGAPEIPALGVPGLVLLALLLVGAGALLMRSRPS